MKAYTGKTALITGASSGIGLALAHALARRGTHVLLTARSTETLKEVAVGIQKTGVDAHVFPEDLSRRGAAQRLHDAVTREGLTVDLLINNAGYGRWGAFDEFARDDYGAMIQLNITALTELCHLFIPDMVTRGGGGVINVGSIASFLPVPYASVYASSKAYVLLLSDALRFEYAEQGVRIMTLCPGWTNTNFRTIAAATVGADLGDGGDSPEQVAEQGLDAYLRDKAYVITGEGNKKYALLPRFLSRQRLLNLAGRSFRRRLGR